MAELAPTAAADVIGAVGASTPENAAAVAQYGVTDAAAGLVPDWNVTIPNRSTEIWLPVTSNGLNNRERTFAVPRDACC